LISQIFEFLLDLAIRVDACYFKGCNVAADPLQHFLGLRKEFVANEVAFIAEESEDVIHFDSIVIVCSVFVSFLVVYERCQEGFGLLDVLLIQQLEICHPLSLLCDVSQIKLRNDLAESLHLRLHLVLEGL